MSTFPTEWTFKFVLSLEDKCFFFKEISHSAKQRLLRLSSLTQRYLQATWFVKEGNTLSEFT